MKKIITLCTLLLLVVSVVSAQGRVNWQWQRTIVAAIDKFPSRGGYYTGGRPNATFSKTTWRGLHDAYQMRPGDARPRFDPMQARPSFCSSATYALLVQALLDYDKNGVISAEAWRNMKPYVGIKDSLNPDGIGQDDGVGFWGRCNANGPALAVLVHELDAGFSITAFRGAKNDSVKETPGECYLTDEEWRAHPIWRQAVRGDLMKIFWNRNETRGHDGGAIVGYDGVKGHLQEAGHSVVFLGMSNDGRVVYWSSNGPGADPAHMGYSVAMCDPTAIQRVVFTRILRPEQFDRVSDMGPTDVNQYLYDLNGRAHSTTSQLLDAIGAK
ncbi:MAG: hypothetical protein J5980_02215 [Muribaculaceae bacterium]|nr:hypothetical protein [Muribaculaceae bacterium]